MFYLIIEDEPFEKLGKFLDYLDQKGIEYRVMSDEKSGREFLAKNSSKIDLIITDLGLPKGEDSEEYNIYSGIEIVDDFRVRNRKIPVLINSATELDEISKNRLAGIEYTQVQNLAELDEMHIQTMLNMMKDKTIKIDEKEALRRSAKGKTGFIINGEFYYSHNGD